MLDRRWRKVRIGLLLYGFTLVLGFLVVLATMIAGYAAAELHEPALVAMLVGYAPFAVAGLSALSFLGVLLYATVPSESDARPTAIVAAIAMGLGAAANGASFALPPDTLALIQAAQNVLGLVVLFAMLRSLHKVASFIREDALYFRAHSLSIGTIFLFVAALGAGVVAFLMPFLFVVILGAIAFGGVIIGILYMGLVLRMARAIGEMIA